jgi:hypothetical protein
MKTKIVALMYLSSMLMSQTTTPKISNDDLISLAIAELRIQGYESSRYGEITTYCELEICTVKFVDMDKKKELDDFTFIDVVINKVTMKISIRPGLIFD